MGKEKEKEGRPREYIHTRMDVHVRRYDNKEYKEGEGIGMTSRRLHLNEGWTYLNENGNKEPIQYKRKK